MKKITLLIAVLIGLTSCESKEDVIKQNVSEHIKKNMNDPDSFEFVEMKPLDTITKSMSYDKEIAITNIMLEGKEDRLASSSELIESYKKIVGTSNGFDKLLEDAELDLEKSKLKYDKLEKELDSLNTLKKNASANDIEYFKTTVRVRGKNSFNAVILTDYTVLLDKDLNVTSAKQSK